MSQILLLNDYNGSVEEVRLMKLEAIWILTNLAYGTKEDIDFIL